MPAFFIGFLLVFLDFKIDLANGGVLNLLPAFLGYALLLFGSFSFAHENDNFKRIRIFTPIALFLSIAEFVLCVAAVPLPVVATLVISIFMTVVALYITYEFSEGAKKMERSLSTKLDADKISAAWIILCMTSLLEFLVFYFPSLLLPCALVHWLAVAWLCSAIFHFGKKLRERK